MKLKIIILTLIGLSFAVNSLAVSLKVAPSSIQVEAVSGRTGQGSIIIENPGLDVAVFEVYPDDFSDWINVNPASFVLNPGEKKQALVSANFKEEGVYATTLSVVSKPLSDREFKANAGVKIPLEIRISEKKDSSWTASILENFKKLFKDQQSLIYIFSVISILVLCGLLVRKNKKVKL